MRKQGQTGNGVETEKEEGRRVQIQRRITRMAGKEKQSFCLPTDPAPSVQLLTAHRQDYVLKRQFAECLLRSSLFPLPDPCWRSLVTNKVPIGYQTQEHRVSKRSICKSSRMKLSNKNKLWKTPLPKCCPADTQISLDCVLPSPGPCPKSTRGSLSHDLCSRRSPSSWGYRERWWLPAAGNAPRRLLLSRRLPCSGWNNTDAVRKAKGEWREVPWWSRIEQIIVHFSETKVSYLWPRRYLLLLVLHLQSQRFKSSFKSNSSWIFKKSLSGWYPAVLFAKPSQEKPYKAQFVLKP